MKKLLSIILVVLMLTALLASCGTPVNTNLDTDTNTDTTSDTSQEPVDTSIKVEYDAEREASDNEFPFDNIVVERNGYDIVSAGRYYGNDFDNIKYYGSYYRIIDNYNDFSELTAWGNKIDVSVFDENFILVLHTYKNKYIYYSNSDEKGTYNNFGINTRTNSLAIEEEWIIPGGSYAIIDPEGNIIQQPEMEDKQTNFPADVRETIYLIIPKKELPENVTLNGEIYLMRVRSKLE